MSLINLPPEVEPVVDKAGRLTAPWRVALEEAGDGVGAPAYAAPTAAVGYDAAQLQAVMAQLAALTAAVNRIGSGG